MTVSTEQDTRTWDMTLVVRLLIALSAVTDAVGFLRLAPSFGLPAWVAALAVIPIKLIEWKALTLSARLWRKGWRGKLQCPVYWIIWSAAVALSGLATHATTYTLVATADYTATKNAETRGNIAAAHQRVTVQLDTLTRSSPRPVNTVEKDLAWANSVLRPPLDCTRVPDEGSRACRRVVELRKELAAAADFERLIKEEQELREKLASLKIEAANDAMPQAYEASIGLITKMDGKNGIALLVTIILGLASAFGEFGLDTLRERQVSPARPALPAEPVHPEGEGALRTKSVPLQQSALPVGEAAALPALPLEGTLPAAPESHREGARVIRFPDAQDGPEAARATGRARNRSGKPAAPRTRSRLGPAFRPPQTSAASRTLDNDPGAAPADVASSADSVIVAAVRAFVSMLEMGPQARATGSELCQVYAEQRLMHAWPPLPPHILGMHLKVVVEELGGRKLKSNGRQVYEGVRLPAAWRAPLSMSA
jgi:hypothetical protein